MLFFIAHKQKERSIPCPCSEGSVALGSEMLRGVYTERSACAQHDSAVTHTDSWINLLNCIIAPQEQGQTMQHTTPLPPGPKALPILGNDTVVAFFRPEHVRYFLMEHPRHLNEPYFGAGSNCTAFTGGALGTSAG